jgi:hypothetical protein
MSGRSPVEKLAGRLMNVGSANSDPVVVGPKSDEVHVTWEELYIECARLFARCLPKWMEAGWGLFSGFTLVKRNYDGVPFWEIELTKDSLEGEDVLEPSLKQRLMV